MDTSFTSCHHSLVTPIDWKHNVIATQHGAEPCDCHHSLVTPIDWKPENRQRTNTDVMGMVTTRW